MDNDFTFKQACLDDKETILHLIGEAIDAGAYAKLSIQNTSKSVNSLYYSDFLPILCNQDPFLIIFCKDIPVGMTAASTFINSMYDLDEKSAVGLLTFIKKEYRQHNLLKIAHQKMTNLLKDLGINKLLVERICKNKKSIRYNIASRYIILDI